MSHENPPHENLNEGFMSDAERESQIEALEDIPVMRKDPEHRPLITAPQAPEKPKPKPWKSIPPRPIQPNPRPTTKTEKAQPYWLTTPDHMGQSGQVEFKWWQSIGKFQLVQLTTTGAHIGKQSTILDKADLEQHPAMLSMIQLFLRAVMDANMVKEPADKRQIFQQFDAKTAHGDRLQVIIRNDIGAFHIGYYQPWKNQKGKETTRRVMIFDRDLLDAHSDYVLLRALNLFIGECQPAQRQRPRRQKRHQ